MVGGSGNMMVRDRECWVWSRLSYSMIMVASDVPSTRASAEGKAAKTGSTKGYSEPADQI